MKRMLLSAVVATAFAASPGLSVAQFNLKFKVNTPGSGEKLKSADESFRKGFATLPQSYGADPEAEVKAIEAAEASLKAGKSDLGATGVKLANGFEQVEARGKALEAAVALARLQLACSQARADIRKTHATGAEASEAQLKKLDDAVAAFAAKAGPESKEPVAWWQKEAKHVREKNPELARGAKTEADRKAREAIARKLKEVEGPIDAMVKENRRIMSKAEEAIPDTKLQAFVAEIAKVKAAHAPAAAYYEREARDYRYYNAWFAPEGGIPAAVASALDGEVVASGENKDKKLTAEFAAKADWCYLVASRWKTWTGQERRDRSQWSTRGPRTPLQHFSWWRDGWQWGNLQGVCATAAVPSATLTMDLTFAGTRNGMRYVVVGWPRDKFPIWLGSYASVHAFDLCDTEAWKSLWLNPIPGTLVWGEKEPYLVTSPDGPEGVWISTWNLSARQGRAMKTSLSGKPPEKRAVATQFAMPKCSSEDPTDPDSAKLAACNAAIDKKYGPLFEQANNQKEYAKSVAAYQAAKQRLDSLSDQQDKEWNARCKPIEDKIAKRWEAMFNALVDTVVDRGLTDRLDTPKQWMDERESFY